MTKAIQDAGKSIKEICPSRTDRRAARGIREAFPEVWASLTALNGSRQVVRCSLRNDAPPFGQLGAV